MGPDGIGTVSNDIFHDFSFVVRFCFSLFNRDGPFWAGSNACTQSIAKEITDQSSLSINELDCTFWTIGDAKSASIAFGFINVDDLSFHLGLRYK